MQNNAEYQWNNIAYNVIEKWPWGIEIWKNVALTAALSALEPSANTWLEFSGVV